ncbi:MAG: hypothetical protein AAF752_01275 [Bacteroidota bacterium]
MSFDYIAILVVVCLIGLGFLILTVFGLRNLFQGKHNAFSIGALVLPLVVFGICYAISGGDLGRAGILTIVTMLGLAIVGLLVSGVRGLTG